jgi:hypothetical protein
MSRIGVADREAVASIVEQFAGSSWPMDRPALAAIAERLGWTVMFEVPKGMYYTTALPLTPGRADALISDGAVNELTVEVTDRVGDDDEHAQDDLLVAFTQLRTVTEELLGAPATVRRGATPRITWDLDNGGRVAVQRLPAVVILLVLQKLFADLERFEESRGMPSDTDPLAGND